MNEKDKCKLYRQALEKWGTADTEITYAPRSEFIELRNRELLGMVWAYERE